METLQFQRLILILTLMMISYSSFSFSDENKDSTKVFYLGEVVILGNRSGLPEPFRQSAIRQTDIRNHHLLDASRALNMLTGLSMVNIGSRNESMVYVRGFDLRQVPVFVDGIPVYVPYDGYTDLARYTTFDLSEITAAKNFSSVIYGANTLGGAVNFVTRRPDSLVECDAVAGIVNGSGYNYSLNLGSNRGFYYIQGNLSELRQSYFRLSNAFTPTATENGGKRDNSDRSDARYGIRIGFTPNKTDEYSFSRINHQGSKGNPVYTGRNESTGIRFWRWPDWDKVSEYLITQTLIFGKDTGSSLTLKSRFFHDKFVNAVYSYDDASYTAQTKKSSFKSSYDDDVWGAVIEATARNMYGNKFTAVFHWKHDIHREHDLGEPVRVVRDATMSFGIEDVCRITDRYSVISGISYDFRRSLQAHYDNWEMDAATEFPKSDSDAWNFQFGIIHAISAFREVSFSIARKTRFATMKDRYSYKLGTAIPNPQLKPERAVNYDLSYRDMAVPLGISVSASLFYNSLSGVIQQISNVHGNLYQMQNLGKARHYGYEIKAVSRPASSVTVGADYFFLKRENISDPSVRFTDTPEHKVILHTRIRMTSFLEIGGSMEYNSDRFSTSDGRYAADEFAVVNAGFTLFIYDNLGIEGGMENIFDRNYSLSEGYPVSGRNGYLMLRFGS